jgi:hypothetical protein
MSLLNLFRRKPQLDAAKRLERIVQETFHSFECEQYRRRRAAALKGKRR